LFENPAVNLSAFRNWCVKIACCSSQLIFTFLYAGSSIQTASERLVWCVHLYFVNFIQPHKQKSKGFRSVDSNSTLYLSLDAGLLARSQYSEGPATGHLDTGFSCFPCVYKRMLRWFLSFQVATTCFSCSPPDLNFLITFSPHVCVHVK